jgi:hypothetical protein
MGRQQRLEKLTSHSDNKPKSRARNLLLKVKKDDKKKEILTRKKEKLNARLEAITKKMSDIDAKFPELDSARKKLVIRNKFYSIVLNNDIKVMKNKEKDRQSSLNYPLLKKRKLPSQEEEEEEKPDSYLLHDVMPLLFGKILFTTDALNFLLTNKYHYNYLGTIECFNMLVNTYKMLVPIAQKIDVGILPLTTYFEFIPFDDADEKITDNDDDDNNLLRRKKLINAILLLEDIITFCSFKYAPEDPILSCSDHPINSIYVTSRPLRSVWRGKKTQVEENYPFEIISIVDIIHNRMVNDGIVLMSPRLYNPVTQLRVRPPRNLERLHVSNSWDIRNVRFDLSDNESNSMRQCYVNNKKELIPLHTYIKSVIHEPYFLHAVVKGNGEVKKRNLDFASVKRLFKHKIWEERNGLQNPQENFLAHRDIIIKLKKIHNVDNKFLTVNLQKS